MNNTIRAICFGEILFNVFPNSEKIGGAPLNVASRLSAIGIRTIMISKVGANEKGKILLDYLKSKSIENSLVTKTKEFQTGVVNVSLSTNGSAS